MLEGLDSYAALSVMEHMSALAKLGHTIITTIHQPRPAIWDKFHKVNQLSIVLHACMHVCYTALMEAFSCMTIQGAHEHMSQSLSRCTISVGIQLQTYTVVSRKDT